MADLIQSVLVKNEHDHVYELKIPANPETGADAYIISIPAMSEILVDLDDWLRVEWEDSKIIAQKNQLNVKKIYRYPTV